MKKGENDNSEHTCTNNLKWKGELILEKEEKTIFAGGLINETLIIAN